MVPAQQPTKTSLFLSSSSSSLSVNAFSRRTVQRGAVPQQKLCNGCTEQALQQQGRGHVWGTQLQLAPPPRVCCCPYGGICLGLLLQLKIIHRYPCI
jgi:hypothetical protein